MLRAIQDHWERGEHEEALRLASVLARRLPPGEREKVAALLIELARDAPRSVAEPALAKAAVLRQRYASVEPTRVMGPWPYAEALARWGEPQRAAEVMARALEKHPTTPELAQSVCLLVARVLDRAGDLSGAEAWLRRALTVPLPERRQASVWSELQYLLARTGRLVEAAKAASKAADCSPTLHRRPTQDDASALAHAAEAWVQAGDPERGLFLAEWGRRIVRRHEEKHPNDGSSVLRAELAICEAEARLALGRDASAPLADAARDLSGVGGALGRRLEAARERALSAGRRG